MLKQAINTWKIMILKNRQNTYCTLISIICMVGQWLVVLLMMDLSASRISWWITWITKSILAPETLAIPYKILSDYYKQVADEYRTHEINKISLPCFDDNKTMATDKLTEKLHMKLRIHQYIFLVGQMYSWLYVLLNSRF